MSRPSEEAIRKATGLGWQDWFGRLDAAGAHDMPHKEIARWLLENGGVERGWWAQTIAIAYEKRVGRRATGQTCKGDYEASASRTLPGVRDEALRRWSELIKDFSDFDGIAPAGAPTVRKTERWHYWRLALADDTRVVVSISAKDQARSVLGLSHQGLSAESRDRWKAYWKSVLARL